MQHLQRDLGQCLPQPHGRHHCVRDLQTAWLWDSGTLNSSVSLREGSRPQWVDLIQCRKTDTSLWQCPSGPWTERKAGDPPCIHRASFRASLAPPSTSLSELHPVTFFLSLGNAQIPAILSLLHTPPPANTHSFQLSQLILRPLPTPASPGSLSSTSWLVRFHVYSMLSWEVHLSSVPGSCG